MRIGFLNVILAAILAVAAGLAPYAYADDATKSPSQSASPTNANADGALKSELPTMSDIASLMKRVEGESPDTMAMPIKILLLLTILSVIPAVLILMTSFTRILIVLAFIRTALTTRSIPPNQVLLGLALCLTFFVMAPSLREMNATAIQPYMKGQMASDVAIKQGLEPLRKFMFRQTAAADLKLFVHMAKIEQLRTRNDVPTYVLVPAFVISELKRSFELGFVLFLPFLLVDLVVASVLLSMGMMMLPPVMISAPLKILLFVLVDGWHLIVQSLVMSFG